MEQLHPIVQVILGISALVVTGGIPLFIFQFKLFTDKIDEFATKLEDLGKKIDTHIGNYAVHKIK